MVPKYGVYITWIGGIYLLSLIIWAQYHKWQSKKLGLKAIILLPCGQRTFQYLANKKGVIIPKGKSILEMHLNTKVSYSQECPQAMAQFQADITSDLNKIRHLESKGTSILTLNTFNKYWLDKTIEVLGGRRYRGIVLTKASCALYTPKKHKKIFKKMFPKCTIRNPGRDNPTLWDLIIIREEIKD